MASTFNSIIIGFVFVIIGTISVLCDKWQLKIEVEGIPTRQPHIFLHIFFVWVLKQLLQLMLLPLHAGIDKDFLGLGRLRHAEPEPRANHLRPIVQGNLPQADQQDEANQLVINEEENRQAPRVPRKRYTKLIYLLPALLEAAHVILMYFGLRLTYGSSFIMLKGSVMFFTALLSLAFLAQQLAAYIWVGVVVTTIGFGVSGISDYIHNSPRGYEKYGIAAGDLLLVMGQIVRGTRLIYEEKFLRKHSIHPMVFLGSEAAYGTVFALILFTIFNCKDSVQYSELPNNRIEDVVDAVYQLSNSWQAIVALIGSVLTSVVFAYLGILLVKDVGALPRIMIEALVWALFWTINVALHWENFFIAQIPGLCLVPIGLLIYSHILQLPCAPRARLNEGIFINPANEGGEQPALAGAEDEEEREDDEEDDNDEAMLIPDAVRNPEDLRERANGGRNDEPLLH